MKKTITNWTSESFGLLTLLLENYNGLPTMDFLPKMQADVKPDTIELTAEVYGETLYYFVQELDVRYACRKYEEEEDHRGFYCIFDSFRRKILDAYRDAVFQTISKAYLIKERISCDNGESITRHHYLGTLEILDGGEANKGACMKVEYDGFKYMLVFTQESVIVINPISGETTIVPLNNDTVKEVFYTLEYMLY